MQIQQSGYVASVIVTKPLRISWDTREKAVLITELKKIIKKIRRRTKKQTSRELELRSLSGFPEKKRKLPTT